MSMDTDHVPINYYRTLLRQVGRAGPTHTLPLNKILDLNVVNKKKFTNRRNLSLSEMMLLTLDYPLNKILDLNIVNEKNSGIEEIYH